MEDLKQTIRNESILALEQVKRASLILEQTRQSSRYYKLALKSENEKLKEGLSTVLDIINTEDRLSALLQSEITAQADYCLAIARLRFVTGTLLSGEGFDFEVESQTLTEIPEIIFAKGVRYD